MEDFLIRAFLAGIMMCLCASLLGVTLVLKRFSLIGDGLSHVGFGAVAVAMALNQAPLPFCIVVVVISSYFLLKMGNSGKMKGDGAIGLLSGVSLAVGITASSLSGGINSDIYGYMFGSVLAMSKNDVILCVCLCSCVILFFVLFYNQIFAITFDENFAKAIGVNTNLYMSLIAFLTAITVVVGIRMMGALLISNLIIFPPLTSMRVFKNFKSVVISSSIVSVVCFITGMIASYKFNIPVGASVVLANAVVFGIFNIFKLKES